MRAVVIVALLVTSVALSGCFDPYRARVPQSAIDASGMEWNVTVGAQHGKTFGAKTIETRYVHLGDGSPPYPGALQVFSVRGGDKDLASLLEFTQQVVEAAIEREGISIDGRQDDAGERTLKNGKSTAWFTHEGVISRTSEDSIFLPTDEEDLIVRVLGEVLYDGKSKTAVVLVGFVQVGERTPGTLLVPESETGNEQTWIEIVGDPTGSIGGASLAGDRGFIYHLKTHG